MNILDTSEDEQRELYTKAANQSAAKMNVHLHDWVVLDEGYSTKFMECTVCRDTQIKPKPLG